MNWLEKWAARRKAKELRDKINEMKTASQVEDDELLKLSATCTISHRIWLLEQAAEKIETQLASTTPST